MLKRSVLLAFLLVGCTSKEVIKARERCENYDQIGFISCINKAAQKLGEPDLCNKIKNQGERVQCKRQTAISQCDVSICKSITKSWLIEDCEFKVQEAIQCVTQ